MRLHLPLAILLALGAYALPAASAEDPCAKVPCPRPVLVVDEERVCAGYTGDFGGQAWCWFAERPGCVTRYFWNAYQEICLVENVAALSGPCGDLVNCPRPVYSVGSDHACVGVAFDIGGTAVCWYAERPHCVTRHFGFAYSETCVPLDEIIG